MMEWSQCQEEIAKSVFSLVKHNNGFWKSVKQRNFIQKQMSSFYMLREDHDESFKNYGVKLTDGQLGWTLNGSVSWAEYGARSIRQICIFFVIDEFGIVSQNKIHFTCSSDGRSSCPNPSKTEVTWQRDESIDKPVLEIPAAVEVVEKIHLGKVGEWIEIPVIVKSVKCVGESYYGMTYQTRMIDAAGNVIIYWGVMRGMTVGDEDCEIKLRAKVKEHGIYNGTKQTIVGYAKIKE